MDATHMGVCDLTWPAEEGSAPELKVCVHAVSFGSPVLHVSCRSRCLQ